MHHCQTKKSKKFLGRGHCPLSRPLPTGEGIPPPQTPPPSAPQLAFPFLFIYDSNTDCYRYLDFSFLCAFAKSPQMELSFMWNFRSVEHSLPWSEKSKNFRSRGTFILWNFRPQDRMSPELSLNGTFAPILKKVGGQYYSNLSVGVFWQW